MISNVSKTFYGILSHHFLKIKYFLYLQAEFTTNGGPPEVKIIDSKTGKEEDGQLKKDVANAIGQAHDMFSRIFRIRINDFFLPNIM